MARNPFRGRGFKEYKEEVARRDEISEKKKGKLWRMFLKDGEEDVGMRFLTDEPVLFYEHNINDGGTWVNILCDGEDCKYCSAGNKPSYKGAFLVVDGREFEVDQWDDNGNKTGKKIKVKDRVKLYVRGRNDLAKLDRINSKFGLLNYPFYVTKVGSGNNTSYELDRGEKEPLTSKMLQKYLSILPEKYENMDVYDILEVNIYGDEDNKSSKGKKYTKDEIVNDVDEDVIDVETSDDEEITPKRRKIVSSKNKKKQLKIRKK